MGGGEEERMTARVDVAANLERVRERIERAAERAGRRPEEILLLGATKGVDVERIEAAIEAGLTDIGENYVQEARGKIERIGRDRVRWHMIGRLQRNKAKHAVRLFDVIQTVDSTKLADELEKRAAQEGRALPVLVEVNIGREPQKAGVMPEELLPLCEHISKLPHLKLEGLMCIPPWSENPEDSRPYFAEMRELFERLKEAALPNVEMRWLSMGMSADFEIAIEEGANLVRIGTAIFGPREGR